MLTILFLVIGAFVLGRAYQQHVHAAADRRAKLEQLARARTQSTYSPN